jgi:hypothetical protein
MCPKIRCYGEYTLPIFVCSYVYYLSFLINHETLEGVRRGYCVSVRTVPLSGGFSV